MGFLHNAAHDAAHKFKEKVKDGIQNIHELVHPADNEEEKREKQYLAESHRYKSFAPVRHHAQVKYFVDGHDYCWAVSEALEQAQESIFIEDWWLTPELYLRRPPAKYPGYRIDALLKRKAEEGVKIFVVVYKEIGLALPLDSDHTKKALQNLHKNIIVQRHPDHAIGGTYSWSHHEKFVVIDNRIAFLGGIDLCFGRWDTHGHPLADCHTGEPGSEVFPGQDYSDARVRDFKDVKNWDMHLIDKTSVPRMPWHDMSLCMLGGPVLDVARHFCERWNFIKNEKAANKDSIPLLEPPIGGFSSRQSLKYIPDLAARPSQRFRHGTRGIRGTCRTQVLRSSAAWSSGIEKEKSIQNAYIEVITQAKHYVYIENQFFITATDDERGNIVENQIGTAIVKRIIKAKEEAEKFKVFVLIPLMPAFPADLITKDAADAKLIMHYQYVSICRENKSIFEKLRRAGINPEDYIRFYSLRSYDRINHLKLEEMMARAAGFSPQPYPSIEDQVQATRISDSHASHVGSHPVAVDSIAKNAMLHGGNLETEPWVGDSALSQPRDDEAEKLERSSYVTEELYIHAKLLIADDRTVIMGSANLNDRSQCGDRDSEIALLVEDLDFIPSRMDGQEYEAARFAATLRRQLWKEHLGLLPDQSLDKVTDAMRPLPVPQVDHTDSKEDMRVQDPLDERALALWNDTARTNTEAFRKVFHCVPDQGVTNWDQYKSFYPDPSKVEIGHVYDQDMSVEEIRANLRRIHGHLVEFPYSFLENVDLKGGAVPFLSDVNIDINTIQRIYT